MVEIEPIALSAVGSTNTQPGQNPDISEKPLGQRQKNRTCPRKPGRMVSLDKQVFTRYRNEFKVVTIESEARYYSDRFTECANNLNETWKIMKQTLNSNEVVGLSTKFII